MGKRSRGPKKELKFIVSQTIESWSLLKDGRNNINYIPRTNRPIMIIHQEEDQCLIIQDVIEAKIGNKKISLSSPNEISLSLNIANGSLEKLKSIKESIVRNIGEDKERRFYKNDVSEIYDYFEEAQKTIVFSYKAIEAMCNSAIPDNYRYTKKNSKGIPEVYDKLRIERWISTTEKVSKILPDIYHCTSPEKKNFWGHFKKMEELRNNIIHSKSSSTSEVLSELLSSDIAKYVQSCEELMMFFFEKDKKNLLFPIYKDISVIEGLDINSIGEIIKHNK